MTPPEDDRISVLPETAASASATVLFPMPGHLTLAVVSIACTALHSLCFPIRPFFDFLYSWQDNYAPCCLLSRGLIQFMSRLLHCFGVATAACSATRRANLVDLKFNGCHRPVSQCSTAVRLEHTGAGPKGCTTLYDSAACRAYEKQS